MFKKKAVFVFLFLLVLLLSAWARKNTFWLPQWHGDQLQYIALAQKLDKFNFDLDHFNLRGIRLQTLNLGPEGQIQIAYPEVMDDPTEKGDIVQLLTATTRCYYDQDIFHKPYGFPAALTLSHRALAQPGQPYTAVVSNLGPQVKEAKPPLFFQANFWAAIVPFSFGLGLVIVTFFLGKILFSYRVGLYAAFMVGIHPVNIMTSQRIWADEMVSFSVALAVLLFALGLKKKWSWPLLLAGISCGIGVLAKQTAGYLFFAIWAYTFLIRTGKIKNLKTFIFSLFNKDFLLFSAGLFLVSGSWFLRIYRMYGNPIWLPSSQDVVVDDGWQRLLRQRPPGWVLHSVGLFYLCPLLLLAYLAFKDFFLNLFRLVKQKAYDYRFILLWVVFLTFLFMLWSSREQRRLAAVYPQLAVLSAVYFEKFINYKGKYARFLGNKLAKESMVAALFIACAFWSVPIGVNAVIENQALILRPF